MSDPSDPTPEHPGMDDDAPASGGQVSEAGGANLDPAAATTPISDSDAVAGEPTGESGRPDEPTEAGPNAIPGDNRAASLADHRREPDHPHDR